MHVCRNIILYTIIIIIVIAISCEMSSFIMHTTANLFYNYYMIDFMFCFLQYYQTQKTNRSVTSF